MMQITTENRPICQKCNDNHAFTLYVGIWLCAECFTKHWEKETKLKQQHIMEG